MAVTLWKQWGTLVSCTCQRYREEVSTSIFSQYLIRIQISAYFYVDVQNLVKIRRSTAELLHIFFIFNMAAVCPLGFGDVIADQSRFVFDGPNTLLKLPFDRTYTLQDIVIFIFGPFGSKLPIHAPFWGVFGGYYHLNEFRYCRNPNHGGQNLPFPIDFAGGPYHSTASATCKPGKPVDYSRLGNNH